MNKKAHHEIGFAPYALILAALGLTAAFGNKMWNKVVKKKK